MRKNINKKFLCHNSDNGITLIALIITIIVLVILAAVSISVAYKSRVVDHAINGTSDYSQESLRENKIMEGTGHLLDSTVDRIGDILNQKVKQPGTEVTKPINWTSNNITAISDGTGNPVPLPKDFYYIGGDINTGIVISDRREDTLTSSGIEMGNQFVWIPVKNADNLKRAEFDENGNAKGEPDATYTEPYSGANSIEIEEYNKIREQIAKYGGFFIGRFEAGVNSVDLRSGTTDAVQVVSKRGVAPYNHIAWGNTMVEEGENAAVYLARSMYKDSPILGSTLCYGCEWDAVCRYIGDNNRQAKLGSIKLTGSDPTDVSKNIYDLAGNCLEWTMEAGGTAYRIQRGGFYNYAGRISERTTTRPSITSQDSGFRIALYVREV